MCHINITQIYHGNWYYFLSLQQNKKDKKYEAIKASVKKKCNGFSSERLKSN